VQKRTRDLVLIGVTFFLCACDNFGQTTLTFPAHIASVQALESERPLVQSEVEALIEKVGSQFLVFTNSPSSQSTVTIHVVDQFAPATNGARSHSDLTSVFLNGGNFQGRAMASKNRTAGRATRYNGECLIEIGRFVVEYGETLLGPVLWHEIGHCAGLEHTEAAGELMSRITYPMHHYDTDHIERFVQSLLTAIQ
jgi:hypothetical protein